MREFLLLFGHDMRRRLKDSFLIGYSIIFPMVMILLLGLLTSGSYGGTFTGYQYYSIVMLTFCIAMAVITAAYTAKEDAYKKTAVRFLIAPIKPINIVLVKLLSCTIVISMCNLIVLAFALLFFRLPISGVFVPIAIVLDAEAFTVSAIGLFIGFGMKNFLLVKNVMNIPICGAGVLGGAFFPMGSANPVWNMVMKISPLTWMNRGIFLCIYDKSSILLWRTVMAALFIGLLFTILAVILFKKEEYIHGDLPGFNK